MSKLMITPEILLRLGFVNMRDIENSKWSGPPVDVPHYKHPQICFIEKEIRRQAILLILEPHRYGDSHEVWYNVDVYLQDDIGCGFKVIPHNWHGLDVDRLNDLYRFGEGKDLPGYHYLQFVPAKVNKFYIWKDGISNDLEQRWRITKKEIDEKMQTLHVKEL
ncbi:MAG TPA: hypothetical protein VEA37_12190 [Flavobacterium sp.]|nr:hypothetical protein [Flavobacterium sp.]